MNTASWGPRTWVYTHTVAQNYKPQNKQLYKRFFTILGDVLPCKYCRASYKEFIAELPMDSHMDSKKEFAEWYYNIHNKVNDKLRAQGYINTRNPSFKCIYKKYEKLLKLVQNLSDGDKSECMWYFLHAISFNFDPKIHDINTYAEAFRLVGETMPYPLIKPVYQRLVKDYPPEKWGHNLSEWLYNIHKQVNLTLGEPELMSYEAVQRKFDAIKSDCNKGDKTPDKGPEHNIFTDLINIFSVGKSGVSEPSKKPTNTCQIPDSATRCKAKTIRGRQCIKCNKNGSSYCPQHQKLLEFTW